MDLSQKESVALGIFLDVSYQFEALQEGWLHSLVTDSGFSEEDLVSDVIGFYTATRPYLNWQTLCQPVSTEASFKVWDANGPVGSHKTAHCSRIFTHARDVGTRSYLFLQSSRKSAERNRANCIGNWIWLRCFRNTHYQVDKQQ